jgi:hypothetical protein
MFTKKVAENFTVQMNEKVIKNTCTRILKSAINAPRCKLSLSLRYD